MKKIILSLGAVATITAPIATVVACGNDDAKTTTTNPIKGTISGISLTDYKANKDNNRELMRAGDVYKINEEADLTASTKIINELIDGKDGVKKTSNNGFEGKLDKVLAALTGYKVMSLKVEHGHNNFSEAVYAIIKTDKIKAFKDAFTLEGSNIINHLQELDRNLMETLLGKELKLRTHISLIRTEEVASSATKDVTFTYADTHTNTTLGLLGTLKISA